MLYRLAGRGRRRRRSTPSIAECSASRSSCRRCSALSPSPRRSVWLSRAADLPGAPSAGWVRLWGIMLLITAILYLPGRIQPVYSRWPNVVGIIARFVLAVTYFWLGRGLRWFGLYELMLALLLAWSYAQLVRAELMSRP